MLRAAELLDEMLRTFPEQADLARAILLCEQEGDRITYDIIQRLNSTFVTPIDREDILALASGLDDIVDLTEEVADYLGLYRIEAPMEQAQRLAHILMEACRQIAEAMPRMRGFKDVSHYTDRDPPARDRRRPGRRARRSRRCSTPGIDPMVVIRWKDIFERLEDAIDATEHDRERAREHRHQELLSRTGRGRVDNDIILVIVVATALAFDFTNGFHDTANSVATSISTRALAPRTAVALAAILNFVGAFISLKVAATIASGIVDAEIVTTTVIFAGLIGAIFWNLLTWYFGLPSSSSHALIGGVVGAAFAAAGADAVKGAGLLEKVIVPALVAPVVAFLAAGAAILITYRMVGRLRPGPVNRGYRLGQIASLSLLSLSHGTNDAQKTMGIITLALITHGDLDAARTRTRRSGSSSRRRARSRWGPTPAAGGSSARWAAGSSRWTRRRASRRRPAAPPCC